MLVVVVVERQVFVFGVVLFVVFVVGIVQLHKIHDADFFLMAKKVVGEMMCERAQFEHKLHSLSRRGTGRQNLDGKEYANCFFHFSGESMTEF